jgi:protein-disulfide isomerase
MHPTSSLLAIVSLASVLTIGCSPSKTGDSTRSASAASIGTAVASAGQDSLTDRADRGRIQGSPGAAVWMIEASDFQCPYCKNFHDDTYPAILHDYVKTGKIRLAYLNFPLEMHQHSQQAAEAAMCASAQDRFWQMHDSLFASQARWADRPDATPVFDSLAAEVGVDTSAWQHCTSTHAMAKLIDADKARSSSNGVQSTPTFFIGNQMIAGAYPYATFKTAIDQALAKSGGPASH